MGKQDDPTLGAQKLTLAAGAVSLQFSQIVYRVADKKLRQREAPSEEEGDSSSPTPSELEALRHRFLEYQALKAASESAWSNLRQPLPGLLMVAKFSMGVYRLTVFCAACVVLYQFVQRGL